MIENNIVYLLRSMECDWDGDWVNLGIFSNSLLAIHYVKENYYLLNSDNDICIMNFAITGEVFKQYGYYVPPNEMHEDEDGLFYYCQYDADEPIVKEYVDTQTVFSIIGIKLDDLLHKKHIW